MSSPTHPITKGKTSIRVRDYKIKLVKIACILTDKKLELYLLCYDINLKKAIINLTCLKSKYTDERSCILSDIYFAIGIHP